MQVLIRTLTIFYVKVGGEHAAGLLDMEGSHHRPQTWTILRQLCVVILIGSGLDVVGNAAMENITLFWYSVTRSSLV